jgi:hypothetical protein
MMEDTDEDMYHFEMKKNMNDSREGLLRSIQEDEQSGESQMDKRFIRTRTISES